MLIQGRCHCGNIAFTLDWQPEPDSIPARACNCTFCTRHGAVWTASPTTLLTVAIRDPTQASAYRFGTRTAAFHVCSTCGVVPVVTSRIDNRLYAVVNVNTFENVDASLLRRSPISFDDENRADRLDRRKHGWIASVDFKRGETCI